MVDRLKIILDVDTGADDALAILLAARSPEVELVGCTAVAGNVPVEQTTRNTLAVLEIAGRPDLPVARGAAHPLVRRLTTATFIHGPQGLGQVELPPSDSQPIQQAAPAFLVEMANKFQGELSVVATGPLTNLALALLIDPEFGRKLKKLVIMGGAVRCPGNITPAAEANFYNDPEAAQAVLQCGAKITLVGLDVTDKTVLKWSELAHLDTTPARLEPASRLALDILRYYCASMPEYAGAHLHDPLAMGVAIWPELVQTERMQVEVETAGKLTRGLSLGFHRVGRETMVDMGEYDDATGMEYAYVSNADVCLQVDAPGFIKLFRERLGL
jgi:purine nucleosidase